MAILCWPRLGNLAAIESARGQSAAARSRSILATGLGAGHVVAWRTMQFNFVPLRLSKSSALGPLQLRRFGRFWAFGQLDVAHRAPDDQVGAAFAALIGLLVDGVFKVRIIDPLSQPRGQLNPVRFADRHPPAVVAGFIRGGALYAREILVGVEKVEDIGAAPGANQHPIFALQINDDGKPEAIHITQCRPF
jgi:hypothetical protein